MLFFVIVLLLYICFTNLYLTNDILVFINYTTSATEMHTTTRAIKEQNTRENF